MEVPRQDRKGEKEMTDLEKLKGILSGEGGGEEPHIWVSVVPDKDRVVVRVFPREPKNGSDANDSVYLHLPLDKIVKL